MRSIAHHLGRILVGLALAGMLGSGLACPGDGLVPKPIRLDRAEARDVDWLVAEIDALLPCRDNNSKLGCMCRPVIEVDLVLPPYLIDKPKSKAAAKVAAESRRKVQLLRSALVAIGDVGNVQIRLEFRTSASAKLILLKPAQIKEARKLAQMIAPDGASQSVHGVVPAKKRRPTSPPRNVVRVTFV